MHKQPTHKQPIYATPNYYTAKADKEKNDLEVAQRNLPCHKAPKKTKSGGKSGNGEGGGGGKLPWVAKMFKPGQVRSWEDPDMMVPGHMFRMACDEGYREDEAGRNLMYMCRDVPDPRDCPEQSKVWRWPEE